MIILQAYKNFGDKVATLKKKLDSLIRDLPETVSPPSGDNVPSPGKNLIEVLGCYCISEYSGKRSFVERFIFCC